MAITTSYKKALGKIYRPNALFFMYLLGV